MFLIDEYPGLKKVALEIAYSNGIINRYMKESDWLEKTFSVIVNKDEDLLAAADNFCISLTEEEQSTLADGEGEEIQKIESRFVDPTFLGNLLDEFFNLD